MASPTNLMLFGYQSIRMDAPQDALAIGKQVLEGFADREGYALTTIFVEKDANKPLAALAALIEAAKRDDVRFVAVPTPMDLGLIPRVRQLTRRTLQVEAGVHVLVVDPRR